MCEVPREEDERGATVAIANRVMAELEPVRVRVGIIGPGTRLISDDSTPV